MTTHEYNRFILKKVGASIVKEDTRLLGNTILRLALPRIAMRLSIIVTAVLLWYWLIGLVYRSGMSLNYKSYKELEAFGPHAVELLTSMNKYIWITANVVITLIALSMLRGWFVKSLARGKSSIVPLRTFRSLCSSLHPEALEVLRWVWKDPQTPVTIGILQTTLKQILSGRVRKMALAKAQREELEQSIKPPANPGVVHPDSSGFREPTLMA